MKIACIVCLLPNLKLIDLNNQNIVSHMQLERIVLELIVLYIYNNLNECFNGDLNEKKLVVERSKIHVFAKENGNPVLKMIE